MAWQHLVEIALQSPVLVVFITSVAGLLVGQQVLQAKDEQLKTKDEQLKTLKESFTAQLDVKAQEIAALERWTPEKLMLQFEAMKRFFEVRTDQQETEIETLKATLEQDRDLSTQQREQLARQLKQARDELEARRTVQLAAEDAAARLEVMTASYARLEDERRMMRDVIRSLERDREGLI